eukprot:Selendium_serpulae@DN6010_c0_g1_i1.p1
MGSSVSSESGNKAKGGGEWKGICVTFHTRTGLCSNCSTETFMSDKVAKQIEDREGNQKITFVEVWNQPLSGWQLTMNILSHHYVIFETYSWYWSMEKTTSGIIIQRAKNKRALQLYQGSVRRPTTLILGRHTRESSADGFGTFSELVKKTIPYEAHIKYSLEDDNCVCFAYRVFKNGSTGVHTPKWFGTGVAFL